MRITTFFTCLSLSAVLMLISCQSTREQNGRPVFSVTFPASLSDSALDGRLLVMLSNNDKSEPRFQISDGLNTQIAFGVDVEGWQAGVAQTVNADVLGYPIRDMRDIPAGEYYVQALLHKYETFHRKDGHVVKLPMDRGEGQQWNRAPGNLYSTPVKINWDPASKAVVNLTVDQVIPPIKEPEDSKYVKHVKIQSKLLTEFWGRPMYLGAHVLLPEGFDQHPEARYPLAIFHEIGRAHV